MGIQRGEIYLVNLNPVEGREQSGRRPRVQVMVHYRRKFTCSGSRLA